MGDEGIRKGLDGGKGIFLYIKFDNLFTISFILYQKSYYSLVCVFMYLYVCYIVVYNYYKNEIVIELNFIRVY